ncbi:MAG TPA: xanthine dehydrogenase family protein subunit M [Phycisphaerae bacterium]|nr:xanthine dehydrogenase family protein subunit M [Phycisphaerae bacterium]
MYLPDVQLHQAASLQDASTLLDDRGPDARLLAGGTDLLVDLKTGRLRVTHLVSLNRIDTLRGVTANDGGLHIGPLTTITDLGRATAVAERFAPIHDATSRMAAPQIRNRATVGGNIASAVPCADLPPILTAMNASVVLWSTRGQREVPLDSFFVGARQTVLAGGEILSGVRVPDPPPGFGAAYARFALRNGNAIAVAAVAASVTLSGKDTVRDARVVLGAVAPVPKLVESAGSALLGQSPDDDAFHRAAVAARDAAEPISDIRGSADFRRHLVQVLTHQALATACARARETL